MDTYYFNGRQIPNPSEIKGNYSFRDGNSWVKVFADMASRDRELCILHKLASCPGVVRAVGPGTVDIDAGNGDTKTYYAIREEYVGEKDIREYCKKHYDEGEMLALFSELAGILAQVEVAGILHNDIKPANILVTEEGRPVLIDFGISVEKGEPMTALHTCGTTKYTAPEKKSGDVSVKSDIYSFGQVLNDCMWQNPKGYMSYSPALKALRSRCIMEGNPDGRYGSFAEVYVALQDMISKAQEDSDYQEPRIKQIMSDLMQSIPHVPIRILSAVLYGSGIIIILLTLYLIIWGPSRPTGYVPSPKEDIATIIQDIRNH